MSFDETNTKCPTATPTSTWGTNKAKRVNYTLDKLGKGLAMLKTAHCWICLFGVLSLVACEPEFYVKPNPINPGVEGGVNYSDQKHHFQGRCMVTCQQRPARQSVESCDKELTGTARGDSKDEACHDAENQAKEQPHSQNCSLTCRVVSWE